MRCIRVDRLTHATMPMRLKMGGLNESLTTA
jgi:hypothetical protein